MSRFNRTHALLALGGLALAPLAASQLSCIVMKRYDEALQTSESNPDVGGSAVITSGDWVVRPTARNKELWDPDARMVVEYTVGPEGISEGGALKLTLGHLLPTEQVIYTPFSLTAPSAYFFKVNFLDGAEAESSNEAVKLAVTEPRPISGVMKMFRYIKYKRSEEGQTSRDNLLRQIDNEYAVLIEVKKGSLAPGDTVSITLGERDGLPTPKRETEVHAIVRVDGDGDGTFGIMPDPPAIQAYADKVEQVRLIGPTRITPGTETRLVLETLDDYFLPNLARFEQATVRLDPVEGLEFDGELDLTGSMEDWTGCVTELPLKAVAPGLYRITGTATVDGRSFPVASNPIEVTGAGKKQIYFGDLHTHSILSYDADRPPEYVWWRQKVQERHDFAALTDHDMIGAVPFAPKTGIAGRTPGEWAYTQELAAETAEEGVFVSLRASEWTSYFYGHRNIFWSPAEVDPPLIHHNQASTYTDKADEQHPAELIAALGDRDYIAIPHSTAWPTGDENYHWGPGDPPETEGAKLGDPAQFPRQSLLELYSTHGTSEYWDNEYAVDKGARETPTDSGFANGMMNYNIRQAPAESGNFARDALAAGWKTGFVGASDMHYLSHLDQAYKPGFTGVIADELSPEGIWEALSARRTYTTTGERILLDVKVANEWMGSIVPATGPRQITVKVAAAGTAPISWAHVVHWDTASWTELPLRVNTTSMELTDVLDLDIGPGHLVYVEVAQEDGNRAWSSPVWFEGAEPGAAL